MFSGASYKGKSSNWMVLWSSKSNKSSHTIIELDFDPAATSHAYKLTVNEDEDMVDEVSDIVSVRDILSSGFIEVNYY